MIQVWVWWLIWLNCHTSTALPSIRTGKIASSEQGHNLAALKDDRDALEGLTARKRRYADNGPSYCIFPFIYKNISYSECTATDDPNGQQWCSTQTDSSDNHMKGNWRHCRNFEGITVSSSSILNDDISGRSYDLELVEEDGKLCGLPVSRLLQRSLLDDFVVQEHKNLAKEGEYPWQVAILSRSLEYRCGGVVVGKRHVITVAHCVADISAGDIVVRVGDFDLSSDDEEYPSYDIAVRWIKIFPGFIEAKLRDDLALLEVKFNLYRLANVGPACLPTPGSLSDVENCKVPGWGQFETSLVDIGSHTFTYKMMVAGFHTISRDVCQATLRASRKVGSFFKLQKGNICALGNDGGDACNGDGGSGLICPNSHHQYVVEGLVSWGLGCGLGHPGAYVDVRYYLDWIIEEMDSPGPQPVHTYQLSTHSTEPFGSSQASTRTSGPIGSSQASTRTPRPVETSQATRTPRPVGTSQATPTPRPVGTSQASTPTPRPVGTSQASTRTPRPFATSLEPSISTDLGTFNSPVVSTISVPTSENVPQIITFTSVDTGPESSTILSSLPLQPHSGLMNFHPRPTNINPRVPVQPTLLSHFTPSAEVEPEDSTLEPITSDSIIRFIPPRPVGPSTSLGTFGVLKPSATDVAFLSPTIVGPVETISTFVPVHPDSNVNFVPPKPVVPSSAIGHLLPSNLPLFGHNALNSFKTNLQVGQLPPSPAVENLNNIPPPPPHSSGTNGLQGINSFSPDQGFGLNPFSPDQGFGLNPFSPDQGFGIDPFSHDQGFGIDPLSPDQGFGFDQFSPGSGTTHGSFGSGSGTLFHGQGTGAGLPGPGTSSEILLSGQSAGILPPEPGIGVHPSGPDTSAGIFPPGPDSYYGPPSSGSETGVLHPGPGAGILHPGPGAGAGILHPGPGAGAGIPPPGIGAGIPPPGTGAGIPPPGPGAGAGIPHPGPGAGAGILHPASGAGAGILHPGPGAGILHPGAGAGAGILHSGPGAGILPPPGIGAGLPPPGIGAGILHPGPGAGAGIPPPGTGAGLPPPGTGAGLPPPGTGAGILHPGAGAGLPPPGTGAGLPPPGTGILHPGSGAGDGILPPGTGAGIPPPGTGAGILHPGPGAGILHPGAGAGIFHPGPGAGAGIFHPGPGAGAGIFHPGTGVGARIFPPGTDILPPGTGAGIPPPGPGIPPPGTGIGVHPSRPDTGAGILLPGPDSYYGPPSSGT